METSEISDIYLIIKETKEGKRLVIELSGGNKEIEIEKTPSEIKYIIKNFKDVLKNYEKGTKIFRINKYLTLKLVNKETEIFVNGKPFRQCKYLLLNLDAKHLEDYDEIKSIDQAETELNHDLHGAHGGIKEEYEITAQDEFQAHCSNLQVWAESNYDTRLLHRNLAFPLLKRLTEVGDPTARMRYRDEIAERLESGEEVVFRFLSSGGYLRTFNTNELLTIAENIKESKTKLLMMEYLERKGVAEASQLLKDQLIKKLLNDDKDSSEYLKKYSHTLSEKEKLTLSKKVRNPIIRILLGLNELVKEYPQLLYFHYDDINNFIETRKKEFSIYPIDNKMGYETKYRVIKSIYGDITCKYAGNKNFLDFGIQFNNKRIVYPVKLIRLAKLIMNFSKDIQICFPERNGALKIFSESEQLKVYIKPEYLL